MSYGMLIEPNLFVIFVMAQNFDAVIYKVIAWQLDTLLLSSVKEKQSGSVTLGWVRNLIRDTIKLFSS